jgi:excisionase family DNA binding protein
MSPFKLPFASLDLAAFAGVNLSALSGPRRLDSRELDETHGYCASATIVLTKFAARCRPSMSIRSHLMSPNSTNDTRPATHDRRENIDILLSLEESMRVLDIGRTLLYKQMSNGELPWVQIGSTRHIRKSDLIEFIERNRKGGRRVA